MYHSFLLEYECKFIDIKLDKKQIDESKFNLKHRIKTTILCRAPGLVVY